MRTLHPEATTERPLPVVCVRGNLLAMSFHDTAPRAFGPLRSEHTAPTWQIGHHCAFALSAATPAFFASG